MPRPALSLIAAVARDGAIGLGNRLLWSEPEDQRHFRRTTLGCAVIMGRKTWDSLPKRFRPLPGRRNLVITRQTDWQAPGAEALPSLEHAVDSLHDAPRAFVIGGAEVYALALPWADELVLTEIDATFEADTFFPAWDRADFELASREAHVAASGVGFSFVTYRRRGLPPFG